MQILNTSPLWSDSGQSYHACDVANVSASPVLIVIDLINSSGGVLATSGASAINLAVGDSVEIANFSATYTGFARCRFTSSAPGTVRANLTVFHWTGTYFDTLANAEAH
jgi:hypothetical protein